MQHTQTFERNSKPKETTNELLHATNEPEVTSQHVSSPTDPPIHVCVAKSVTLPHGPNCLANPIELTKIIEMKALWSTSELISLGKWCKDHVPKQST